MPRIFRGRLMLHCAMQHRSPRRSFVKMGFLVLVALLLQSAMVFAQTGASADSEASLWPLRSGSQWLYRDSRGRLMRRVLDGVREITIEGKTYAFADVKDVEGSAEEIRSPTFKPPPERYEHFYLLDSTAGLLRFDDLAESRAVLLGNGFLFLPRSLKTGREWQGVSGGSLVQFRAEAPRTVTVPAGRFTECQTISYRMGMDLSGVGVIDYCPGVGEVRTVESDYVRELISFTPGKEDLRAALEEAETTRWVAELAKPMEVGPGTLAYTKPTLRDHVWRVFKAVLVLVSIALLIWLFRHLRKQHSKIKRPTRKVRLQLEGVQLLRKDGRQEDALHALQAMLGNRRIAQFAEVWVEKALTLLALGQMAEAAEACEAAIVRDPQQPRALAILADWYLACERSADAERVLKLELGARPKQALRQTQLGDLYRRLDQPDLAKECYRAALLADPHFAPAREQLRTQPLVRDLGRREKT